MNLFFETDQIISEKARSHDSCIVAFSGGKDSLAVMDLCVRAFKRVVGVFFYFIPGMSFVEKQMAEARQRFGVEILQYPHPQLFWSLKNGFYCFPHKGYDDVAELYVWDFMKPVMEDLRIDLVMAGMKKADGLWRRHILASNLRKYPWLVNPLVNWKKEHVLSFLKSRNIPIPESSDGNNSAGHDNSREFILWLAKKHPEDFKLYLEYFPFAIAQVRREEWYGNRAAA